MKKTNAWWVCTTCRQPLAKVGTKRVKEMMFDHRKVCHELAGFSIEQVLEEKKK